MCNASRAERACPRPEPATVPCRKCKGKGYWTLTRTLTGDSTKFGCSRCHGTGRVPARHSDAQLDALVQKVKEA